MKLFGLTITREKALNPVGGVWRNAWRVISEPFSGAWQRNIEEKRGDLTTYPTLYACISSIASDIGKLPFSLRRRESSGVWVEVSNPAYDPVLRKPNGFQTEGQFREYWLLTKLIHGNAYVLKRRDARGVVIEMYVLDPEKVLPMVSDSGAVFYQLRTDNLNTLPDGYPAENLIVPANEIIHDRLNCFHHPLIGVPPLAAAHWPALKNMKIMRSATEFFANNAQPGGLLTAPAGMSEEDAKAVQEYWNKEFSDGKSGKVAIIGADMQFTPFAMKSIDSQMIEQMRYGDEQICQPFRVKPYKIGLTNPPGGWKPYDVNTEYYGDALQTHIEAMESLLDEGLRVSRPIGIGLDLEPLLRMDDIARSDVATKLVGGGIETPNEGRLRFNRPPLEGGDTVYMQQQDYPLDQVRLNKIDQSTEPAEPPAEPEPDPAIEEMRAFMATQKAIAAMKKALEPAHVV